MPALRALVRDIQRAAPKAVADGDRWGGFLDDLNWLPWRNASGKAITAETAMGVSAWYRAVRILADVCASMPIDVFDKTASGRKPVEDEADAWLWRRPNPEVNSFVFWNTAFGHLVSDQNAYLYVTPQAGGRGGSRRPADLWPIEPSRVEVGRDSNGRKAYLIDGTVPEVNWIEGGSIVHLHGFGYDGLKGQPLWKLAAQSLGLALAAEEYASRFLKAGSTPGGILMTDQSLTAEQADEVRERWEANHRGTSNAHRIAVLGRGVKWMTTVLSPEATQLLPTQVFQVSNISRFTGVPEHLLAVHDKTSSWGAGIAEENRGLLTYTVDPYLVNVERTIKDELLPGTRYMKFNRAALLRANPKEQAEVLQIERRNGIINQDEWRELLDREPVRDGSGSVYIVEKNMVPVHMLEEVSKPPSPATPPALEPEADTEEEPRALAITITQEPPPPTRRTVERDRDGRIIAIHEGGE